MSVLEAEDAEALNALIDDCESLGIRRRLLVLRLSRPFARPLRPAVRRRLLEHLAPFAGADRVRLFRLADEDVALTWRDGGPHDRLIEDAAARLTALLAADFVDRPADLLLCALPADTDRARHFLDDIAALRAAPPAWQPPGQALDLRELLLIDQALAQADIARFVRRHRIWDLAGAAPVVRWEHRRLDLADLAAALAPGHDLAADPWLLRRLSRTLDRRLLALLTDPAETRGALPFIIDLGVPSLLDPAFRRFDEALPAALRGRTAVRLAPIDLADDPASFSVARDAATTRGHRLVLAVRYIETLSGFAFPRLGIDHVELSWRALPDGRLEFAGIDPAAIILTDIPNNRALAQARAAGITLASGAAL